MQQQGGQIHIRRCAVHRPDARCEPKRRLNQPLEAIHNLHVVERPLAVRSAQRRLKRMPHKLWTAAEVEDEVVVRIDKRLALPSLQLALACGKARKVHLHRAGAVHDRLHRAPPHRLVKVPRVHNVRHAIALQCERCIRTNQHRHCRRTVHERVLLRRVRHIGRHDDRPTPIPRRALHPVSAREERRRATVARVVVVDALNVRAPVRLKQRHQVALDALAAIEERLRRHLQHADVRVAHAVLLDQPAHRCQRHRHDILVLVARRPLAHHQPGGVLALDAVRTLQIGRRRAVPRHIHLYRVDARAPGRDQF